MNILSFEFLFLVAVTLGFYYLLPIRVRWLALFVGSVFFILSAGWSSALHLTAIAAITWVGGSALSVLKRRKKGLLAFLLLLDLGAMFFLKYEPSVAAWINGWGETSKVSLPVWDLVVPLGLSYFTFQSAGWLIDIYRGKAVMQKNPLKAWLFVGYFPQLAQGPISSWKELGDTLLTGHRLDPVTFVSGFQLMLWGYFKKLVIADRLALTTSFLLGTADELPGWMILGGAVFYTIRLYADFSGGMDVVRGISRMFGTELPENFRRPFFSKSVAEYWQRWHITLGAWFRSYLLYPLTTSRAGIAFGKKASAVLGKKTGRMLPSALAMLLVFLCIGVWHTANWNAVIYGAYFGLLMSCSMLLQPVWRSMNRRLRLKERKGIHTVRMIRTWILITAAQYFAFTSGPGQAWRLFRCSFLNWSFSGFAERICAVMPWLEWGIAGISLLLLLAVDILCECRVNVCDRLARTHVWIRWPVLLLLLLAVFVFGMYGPDYDGTAFLYTQF